jgi:signal transduction histidine kinase
VITVVGRLDKDPVARVVLITTIFIVYVALLAPLERPLGGAALSLAIIPVLAAAWLAGLRMGLAMGLIAGPVGATVIAAVGDGDIAQSMAQAVLPSTAALALVGAVVGRLSDASRHAGVQSLMLTAESRRRQDAESEARAAQEEERRRIAEDVHDDVVQVMAAVNVRLEFLRRRLVDPAHQAIADDIQGTVDQAVKRLRTLIFDLSPPALDRYGLAAALQMKLEQFETEGSLDSHLDAKLSTEPEPVVRVLIYRITQEALSNVRKHARATRVEVSMTEDDAGILVKIHDDGVGFAVPAAGDVNVGHLGFRTMRERAEGVGGWFKVESSSSAGSTISFWVPNRPLGPRSMEPPPGRNLALGDSGPLLASPDRSTSSGR